MVPWNKGLKGAQVGWNKGLGKKKISISCKCGCEEMTALGSVYISGHNTRGRISSPESIKKRTEKVLGQKRPNGNWNPWSTGLTTKNNETVRKLGRSISKTMKRKFKYDKEFLLDFRKARDASPNKLEIFMNELLQDMFPNEWKFVGDFDTFIGGKCPDFINVNGRKQIIEVFGNYWHKKEDIKTRTDHFKQYGFDTLVIWENDINKNLSKVKSKLVSYSRK